MFNWQQYSSNYTSSLWALNNWHTTQFQSALQSFQVIPSRITPLAFMCPVLSCKSAKVVATEVYKGSSCFSLAFTKSLAQGVGKCFLLMSFGIIVIFWDFPRSNMVPQYGGEDTGFFPCLSVDSFVQIFLKETWVHQDVLPCSSLQPCAWASSV